MKKFEYKILSVRTGTAPFAAQFDELGQQGFGAVLVFEDSIPMDPGSDRREKVQAILFKREVP